MAIEFKVDATLCTKCGICAADCPSNIIALDDGLPSIKTGKEDDCLECQHCLAVCPTGAVSVLGKKPSDSIPLSGAMPEPKALEALIKGRRSCRRYVDENLPADLIKQLLEVAWYAPTGKNGREVLLNVVDDKNVMAKIRNDVMEIIEQRVKDGTLPTHLAYFANFPKLWREKKIDPIFRNAPHMLVTSAPPDVGTPVQDTTIVLSYFELYANALGIGTLWCGWAKWALTEIAPQFKSRMGIPENHQIGYAMMFGKPAVKYHRTVQLEPASINFIRKF